MLFKIDQHIYLVTCILFSKVCSLKQTIRDNLSPTVQSSFELGYGCWCDLDGNWLSLSGRPRDELDEICKQLVLGYKCVKRDLQGQECDPYRVLFRKNELFFGTCIIGRNI